MFDRILTYSLIVITSVVLASAVGGSIGHAVDNLTHTATTALENASH